MAGDRDLHEALVDEIERRLGDLPEPSGRSDAQQRIAAILDEDLATVRAHWRTGKADGSGRGKTGKHVTEGTTQSAECDQTQPCWHVRGLARQYRLIDAPAEN